MKLVIGTAQFGMKYGLFNKNKIKQFELKKIEKLILHHKIHSLDTASSYGSSEKVIGNSKLKKLKIITKIKIPKNDNFFDIQNWLTNEISKSLHNLKIDKIYGLIVHDYKDLIGKYGKNYLSALKELKKKKNYTKDWNINL